MSDLRQRIADLSPEQRDYLQSRLRRRVTHHEGQTIPRREVSDHCPLSFAQQRLWFLHQLEPEDTSYKMAYATRMMGTLNARALQGALGTVMDRHEVLRARLEMVEGQPVQVIGPARALEVPLTDLSELPQAEREAEAQRLAREEAQRPYDLERGPLFRARLLKLGEEEHVLLVGMHHIVSDGWSMGVFWRELGALYKAFSEGQPSPLPELPIQYADYAVWQRQWLRGEVLEEQLGYWRHQLSEVPVLELPTDRPRPAVQTHRGARQQLEISRELAGALKELARREGATLFMVLLAAFQVLLSRYSGQEDVAVGTPIAGRNRSETEGLIGFFVNTLVMRTDLSGDPSFRELLSQVREVALGAYEHQNVPFEKLVEELRPERDLSRHPLIQVMFALQNMPRQSQMKLPGLRTEPLKVGRETAKFDLTLSMTERPEGLSAAFGYNTDLFDEATIERMLGHLRTLLESVVADPERRVSELELLSEEERHRLLFEWNETGAEYPEDRCIHELFEEQANRKPRAVAVVYEDQQLTYGQLNRRANRVARHLRGFGVGPGILVGICLERSADMVVAILGILKAGGAYVPLDPNDPQERLSFMLEDAQVSVLLTQKELLERLPKSAAKVAYLRRLSNPQTTLQESASEQAGRATAEDLAYVIYTSGSTGKPKGVCVPHRAVNRLVMNTDYVRLTSADVVAQVSNNAFDAATWEVWGALLNGARLVVLPKETVLSPPDLTTRIEEHGISSLFLTTALFNQVVRENPAAFRALRHLLFGGEAVEPKWVRQVLAEGAPERLLHVYGPTETTTFATWHRVQEVEEGAATIPIGRSVANTKAYVLDAGMRPVPIGVPGELYIGGPGVAHGYLKRPELTAEKFVPDPFSDEPGARLYKTGDLVRHLRDGNLVFLGRVDQQVKLRGFRIELGEIESVLKSHAAVRESVVLLREDTPEQKRLAAYIVLAADTAPSPRELRAFLREMLPEYMVPSAFVALDELPLTPSGKVDRRALPAPEEDLRPEEREDAYVAPRDELEGRLAEIWKEVLGIERVGIHDGFFELGGHSLLAVSLFAQIERAFGRRLPLSILFRTPTVGQLADVLRRESEEAPWRPVVAIQPHGSRPPFFCVHGGGGHVFKFRALAQQLGVDQPFYGLQAYERKEQTVPLTVEDIAASYIREVRAVQPEGPYFLGGFCFGGVVAFEMAQQLHAQGQDVALLALLDTKRPKYRPREADRARRAFHARRLRSLGLLGYLRKEVWRMRIKRRARDRIRFKLAHWSWFPLPSALKNSYILKQRARRATSSYEAQPYPGRITLFRSAKGRFSRIYSDDHLWGWDSVAAGGLEVHEVPGRHGKIFGEKHAGALAARLKTCLEQARTSSS